MPESVIGALLASPEPSVRWKVRTQVLGEPADAREIVALREEIRRSPRARRLLAGHAPGGRPPPAYAKWRGAHWVLASLADIGYPPGDRELHPLRDQVLDAWLKPRYFHDVEAGSEAAAYRGRGVPVVQGRHRRCGSQQGNALWFLTTLGLADGRTGDLAERLMHWQWPDGGWNCDRNPRADTSSFHETLLPMRGLAAHAAATGDVAASAAASAAARRAAEVFLTRRLLYRASTGEPIDSSFARPAYPGYWHYDVLAGLKGMADLDLLGDARCADALDVLESLRLPDGWPALRRHYRSSGDSLRDSVDWGGAGTRHANPWVTADALAVLHAAGRL
ncbi:MAG TPA: hypothetical protein VHI50_02675 [Micromonosporaceae bacterium]|nr:hypothetical protein [Micromonosporaceae bacterium]